MRFLRPALAFVVPAALAAFGLLTGCAPKESAASGTVEVPVVSTGAPEAAARSLIASLRAMAEATRVGDHKTEARLRQIVMSLADTDEIRQVLEKNPSYMGAVGPDPIPGYVDLWRGLVGYYINDVDVAQPAITAVGGSRTSVEFKARGRKGEPATLEFLCIRGNSGWRVGRIQFERPGSIARVVTQPATRVASSSPSTAPAASRPAAP